MRQMGDGYMGIGPHEHNFLNTAEIFTKLGQ